MPPRRGNPFAGRSTARAHAFIAGMALLLAIPSWEHALVWTRPVTASIGREVRRDSEEGGPLARNYWDAFLRRFDPDDALERSRWEMGPVKKDQAEVIITKHGAENPAVLVMRREEGSWKAGLVETFWTR